MEELTLKNAIRKEEEAKDEIFSGDESHIVRSVNPLFLTSMVTK